MSDTKILVNVPFFKPHNKFLPHFIQWYRAQQHDIGLHFKMYTALHHVLETAVEGARIGDYTHILFTEDDHWGYPADGLDVLLAADKDVVGFPTYKKEYPFHPLSFRKRDPSISLITYQRNLIPVYVTEEMEKVDLLSWAFLLVKTSVFDIIENPFQVWGRNPNDSYFCQACEDAGIDRWIHSKYVIPHGDVAPRDIPIERRTHEAKLATLGVFPKDDEDLVSAPSDLFDGDAAPETSPEPPGVDMAEVARIIEENKRQGQ